MSPTLGLCRGCGAPLQHENGSIADGCACNSPRGVNHGLVPVSVCTCTACDPAQGGFSRGTAVLERPVMTKLEFQEFVEGAASGHAEVADMRDSMKLAEVAAFDPKLAALVEDVFTSVERVGNYCLAKLERPA
jgi:hypothetical protein